MKLFANVYRLSRSCSVTYLGILADVKISGQPFSKIVFFCFSPVFSHKFSLKNFFLLGIIFLSICYLKRCINIFCFQYFASYTCFYFLQMFMLCKEEATIFHIQSKRILHTKPSDYVQGFFINLLRNLIMCNTLFVKK